MNRLITLLYIFCCLHGSEESSTPDMLNPEWGGMLHPAKNSAITKMDLSYDNNLHNIEFIKHFQHLKSLNLSYSAIGNHYRPINKLPNLEYLNLMEAHVTTLRYLIEIPSLKSLKIDSLDMGRAAKYLSQLPNLTSIDLVFYCPGITHINEITTLKKIRLYRVFNYESADDGVVIPSLSFFAPLINLTDLNLSCNKKIRKIAPLGLIPNLKKLDISACDEIEDFKKIYKLKKLTHLNIASTQTHYNDLTVDELMVLNRLPKLKQVTLHDNIALPEFSKQIKIKHPKW
jgi:Leucine-rich repeat (LRR) protein